MFVNLMIRHTRAVPEKETTEYEALGTLNFANHLIHFYQESQLVRMCPIVVNQPWMARGMNRQHTFLLAHSGGPPVSINIFRNARSTSRNASYAERRLLYMSWMLEPFSCVGSPSHDVRVDVIGWQRVSTTISGAVTGLRVVVQTRPERERSQVVASLVRP